MARILEEETLPWHSPDVWTPQPHTYAFHAIHASHFVATQCHERFKHGVQDLGDRGKPDVGQPSISTDPSLSWTRGWREELVAAICSGTCKPLAGRSSQGSNGQQDEGQR